MNDMLSLIYRKWPHIKVDIVLLPVYKGILDKRKGTILSGKNSLWGYRTAG